MGLHRFWKGSEKDGNYRVQGFRGILGVGA